MARGGKGYHFLIAKDGTINQLEKLDTPIYHDSAAEYGGPSYNSKAIGVALNNFGFYHDSKAFSATGKFADFKQGPHPHDAKSIRWWQPYTKAQHKAAADLARALKAKFPSIKAVKRHSESSGVVTKKGDPGPLFDMSVFSGIT
jgi:N-acetyl-anhydromuramyl-L-alanine amidase AmpD